MNQRKKFNCTTLKFNCTTLKSNCTILKLIMKWCRWGEVVLVAHDWSSMVSDFNMTTSSTRADSRRPASGSSIRVSYSRPSQLPSWTKKVPSSEVITVWTTNHVHLRLGVEESQTSCLFPHALLTELVCLRLIESDPVSGEKTDLYYSIVQNRIP